MNAYIYAGLTAFQRKRFLEMDKKLHMLKIILEYYNIDMNTLLIRGRKREKVKVLAIACHILYWRGGLTLMEIGRLLKRDHTTVMYHCKVIDDILNGSKIVKRANADLVRDYNNIMELIKKNKLKK